MLPRVKLQLSVKTKQEAVLMSRGRKYRVCVLWPLSKPEVLEASIYNKIRSLCQNIN